MQLTRINDHFYEISEGPTTKVKRFIFTSAETRDICNKPEVLGCDYTDKMEKAMEKALTNFPIDISEISEQDSCIVNFLRGGLNFRLREAMHTALGWNRHTTSFMSSQRYIEDGRWGVKEDQYRKFIFPKNPSIFIGDVVATGVTAKGGLNVVLDAMKEKGITPKNIFFFTFGCHKIEKILDEMIEQRNDILGNTENIAVIYLEGKFRLADSKTDLKIRIPGTDLLRTGAIMAPEFVMSQYEDIAHMLERCTIYDAGSRSFDIPEYLEDVQDYWKGVSNLDMTLKEAVLERWPDMITEGFDKEQLATLDKKHKMHIEELDDMDLTLKEYCERRLKELN